MRSIMAVVNEVPRKYWDFQMLKDPPAYRTDDDPASAAPVHDSSLYEQMKE